jgi:eukaryotic-like serine/threonine-protein kinase
MSLTQPKLPIKFGRFQLVRRLAAGGMGQVFLGMAESFGSFRKMLAIKCLHDHLAENARFVEMFLDEGRLAACLSHPNIVHTFDLGHHEGTFFIAMEYVHGMSLVPMLRRDPLPFPVAMSVALACTAGLAFAHNAKDERGKALNIVHRDIAPKNILVSFGGDVKITDFGIARAADQSHFTKTGEVKGTMNYMPLEQILGQPTDARTDVYAMGATLYEVFTSRPLFELKKNQHHAFAQRDLRENLKPPSEVCPGLPKELDEIILRALAVDADGRFANGSALLKALRGLVSKQGLEPGPELISNWFDKNFPEQAKQPPLSADDLAPLDDASEETAGHSIEVDETILPSGSQADTREVSIDKPETAETTPPADIPSQVRSPFFLQGVALVVVALGALAVGLFGRGGDTRDGGRVDIGITDQRGAVSAVGLDVHAGGPNDRRADAAKGVKGRQVVVVADAFVADTKRVVQKVALSFNSRPKGATVLVDGVQVGQTPLSFPIKRDAEKIVEIKISLARYETKVRKVSLGADQKIHVTLRPKRRRTAATKRTPPKGATTKTNKVFLGDLRKPEHVPGKK